MKLELIHVRKSCFSTRSNMQGRKSRGGTKCLGMAVIIALVISNLLFVTSTLAADNSGMFVDLFTQKAPFDGRGVNQSSDTFGPQELVMLYALILQNGEPVNGILVTYEIDGPANASETLRFYQTATTNSSGIAETDFRLAVVNQTEAFGTWTAMADVQVGGEAYGDILTFKVDYIVTITSLRTLDENLTATENFGEHGYVGFEIALRNSALVRKNATLQITILDELSVPVSTSQIPDPIIPPNQTQYIYGSVPIGNSAVPGNATIIAVALDNNLVAYSPEVSANFSIQPFNPIFPEFTDAGVYVEASPTTVEAGETININLFIMNEGTIILSDFYVTLLVNDSALNSYFISSLSPYQSLSFEFNWNTTGIAEGTYLITGQVQPFPKEANLSNNSYSVQVYILAVTPTILHDIEITYANCSENEVYQGEIVTITVGIRNNGNLTESTNASVYYNETIIEKKPLQELFPKTEQIVLFDWNTTNVPVGTYEIIARADPVEGQTNFAHTVYYDGYVQIKAPSPPPPKFPSKLLELTFFALAVVVGIFGLIFLLFMNDCLRRRRKKRPAKNHLTIIAHYGVH